MTIIALRHAWRSLRASPRFTSVTAATLALGIAALTASLTIAHATLWRPLPFPDSEQLVWLAMSTAESPDAGLSLPDVEAIRRENRSLTSVGAFTRREASLGKGDDAQVALIARVSGDFLSTLGVRPLIGRGFTAEDDRVGAEPTIVLSHELWRTRFEGRRDVVGEVVPLDGIAHSIIGVMPASFAFPERETAAWAPLLPALGAFEHVDNARIVLALGRLAPRTSLSAANRDLERVGHGRARARDAGVSKIAAQPLASYLSRELRPRVMLLLGASLLVLLLASLHAGAMLVTRLLRRRQELALRMALGASPGAIRRLIVVEALLITALGALGGAFLSASFAVVVRHQAGSLLPELFAVGVSWWATIVSLVGAGAAVLLVASLVAGLAAALPLFETLKASGPGSGGDPVAARTRDVLLAAAVATTFVLSACATALVQTYLSSATRHLGFEVRDIYVAQLSLPITVLTPRDQPRVRAVMRSLREELSRAPLVAAAAISTESPAAGNRMTSVAVSGADSTRVGVVSVSDSYFATLGIPIRRGRAFTRSDELGDHAVTVIDETAARTLGGGVNMLGRVIFLRDLDLSATVVGIVGNVSQRSIATPPLPQVYLPYESFPLPWVTLTLRSRASTDDLSRLAVAAVRGVYPSQPLGEVTPLRRALASTIERSRFYAALFATFAAASLLALAVGLHAVVSYLLEQRTRELGVRICLGATPWKATASLVSGVLRLAGTGVVIGLGMGLGSLHVLRGLFFELEASLLAVLVAPVVILMTMSLFSCWTPLRRVASLDAARVLRDV